jgi:pimeloyl-ACP methyl ester carboxylesterase
MYAPSVGYRNFHPLEHFNFQLNRWLPFLPEEELFEAAKKIDSLEDWNTVMFHYARQAESENRHGHAAFYYRAAEFFLLNNNPDKDVAYHKFVEHFNLASRHIEFKRLEIPYENGYLPAIIIEPKGEYKDTLVVHGGFDSFVEELFPQLLSLTHHGFQIIAFEGPGQGLALRKYKIPMNFDWEKPTSTVLDFFNINSCSLLGISLGGYLATRAAAFEPRIKRVIADDVMEDFYDCLAQRLGPSKAKVLNFLLKFRMKTLTNKVLNRAAKNDVVTAWALEQGMHVSGTASVFDYLNWTQQFHTRDISHRLKQDYLLLAGKSDHMVPIEQFYRQAASLVNVRSFTGRIFTNQEHAGNHCQIGNHELATSVIRSWLLATSLTKEQDLTLNSSGIDTDAASVTVSERQTP